MSVRAEMKHKAKLAVQRRLAKRDSARRGRFVTFHVSQEDGNEMKVEVIETGETFEGLEFAIIDFIEGELAQFLAGNKYGEP